MLSASRLAAAFLVMTSSALAQSASPSGAGAAGDPAAADPSATSAAPAVDFRLRPTESADGTGEEDVWNFDTEPELSALDRDVIGPPLLGPTGDEVIGPPLAGPTETPAEARARKRRAEEEDPYAQRGIRLGSFVIRPSIEAGFTATDNVAAEPKKTSAYGLEVTPEINVRSESERHALEASLRGDWIFYDQDQFNEQTAEARLTGRYDLSRLTSIDADLGYARSLDGFTDDNTPGGAAEHPKVDAFDATLGVTRRYGRFAARLSGFADRTLHEDVPLVGGGVASREELDNTELGGRLRVGVDTGASLKPFGEAAVGRRLFDQARDDSGYRRSSVWGELRGGIVVARGEKLSGEASLGYRREDIEDDRLAALNVFLANAAILWSPQRLTDVRLDLTTSTSPSSVPDVSATITYAGTLSLARKLTPRMTAESGVGLAYERPVGDSWRDVTFTGFAGISYAFNRTASLIARYDYEHTFSNDPGDRADVSTVGVRLRLQR